MAKSVLVTGAFGNIGSHVVQHVLAAGHRVVAADLKTPQTEKVAAGLGATVDVVWGNICDPDYWARALGGIDVVIHLAAVIPPLADTRPELAIAVNQTATLELIRQMELSPTAKRLIFASSMTVAGHEQHLRTPPLRVDDPVNPTDPYGQSKAECERHIQGSALQWSILRIAACPPGRVAFGADTSAIKMIFRTSPLGRIEVVHNDDAALAFANAVNCDLAIGKILFVGGGEHCRSFTLEFYNRVFDAIGLGPLAASAFRPGPLYFYGDWLDTAESQQLLAFQRHGIEDIIADLRANAGFKRWFLRLVSPLANRFLERLSPYRA